MSGIFADLPKNHYGAILADPPWAFKCWDARRMPNARGGVTPYQTMDMDGIRALPVADLAASNCVLFMWAVWPTLNEAFSILDAWGFKYKTCAFSWLKADPYKLFCLEEDVVMGMGYWTRANTEPCLLGVRGKPKRLHPNVRQGIVAPRREHSRKPDGIHERIERLVAGPYLELFARQRRKGWDVWGNEVDKFKEAAE
jgi:N6-adenosine-specific RNA methylase IME4